VTALNRSVLIFGKHRFSESNRLGSVPRAVSGSTNPIRIKAEQKSVSPQIDKSYHHLYFRSLEMFRWLLSALGTILPLFSFPSGVIRKGECSLMRLHNSNILTIHWQYFQSRDRHNI